MLWQSKYLIYFFSGGCCICIGFPIMLPICCIMFWHICIMPCIWFIMPCICFTMPSMDAPLNSVFGCELMIRS